MSYIIVPSTAYMYRSLDGEGLTYNAFSMCGWCKAEGTPDGGTLQEAMDSHAVNIGVFTESATIYSMWDTTNGLTPFDACPTVGTWFFQALVFNGPNYTCYWGLNDNTWYSETIAMTGSSLLRVDLGGEIGGHLSNIKVWDHVLSETEIKAERAEAVVHTANLFAHWPLTTVTLLTDVSGGGHTLTAVGSPTADAEQPTFLASGGVAGSIWPTITL